MRILDYVVSYLLTMIHLTVHTITVVRLHPDQSMHFSACSFHIATTLIHHQHRYQHCLSVKSNLHPLSILIRRMDLFRQHFLSLLRHRLLGYLGHSTVTRSMALCPSDPRVMDGVRDFLLDFLGELLLQLLGNDAVAYGVGLVGSLGHDG